MSEQARAILAQADHEREVAKWADSMMCTLRLRRPVIVSEMHQRGPFGRRRKYLYELDDRMPRHAVEGLYRALKIVKREADESAARSEAAVITTPPAPARDENAGGA